MDVAAVVVDEPENEYCMDGQAGQEVSQKVATAVQEERGEE